MTKPKILLASGSIHRRELLKKLGLDFTWQSPDIEETPLQRESPRELVLRLAEAKAKALGASHPHHLIIGSDQVAVLDDDIIGKPHTHEAAHQQLKRFSGTTIKFLTSLCLYNSKTGNIQLTVDDYFVRFRALSSEQIENYLHREQPYDCAGSFKSEGLGICLFEKIEGKDPNTLVGLPLIELTRMLLNEGIDVLLQPLPS